MTPNALQTTNATAAPLSVAYRYAGTHPSPLEPLVGGILVGRCRSKPVKPHVDSAWCQHLKLNCG
jgi:hypothetical protein